MRSRVDDDEIDGGWRFAPLDESSRVGRVIPRRSDVDDNWVIVDTLKLLSPRPATRPPLTLQLTPLELTMNEAMRCPTLHDYADERGRHLY